MAGAQDIQRLVERHFGAGLRAAGFQFNEVRSSPPITFVYQSLRSTIKICMDRGQMYVCVSGPNSPDDDIPMEWLAHLLSPNTTFSAGSYSSSAAFYAALEGEMDRAARCLFQDCSELLAGRFDRWDELAGLAKAKQREYLTRLSRNLPAGTLPPEVLK